MALFHPKFAMMQSYVASSLLERFIGMGSFLIVVIKLTSIKVGDVENL